MTDFRVGASIPAPPAAVFEVIAHAERFAEVVPHIERIEFVSEQRRGVGTRFRETRLFKRREATSELEVTGYEPPRLVRLVADEGGTVWDSTFTLAASADAATTDLTLVMTASAYTWSARLLNPVLRRVITKGLVDDLDAVAAHFASPASGGGGE